MFIVRNLNLPNMKRFYLFLGSLLVFALILTPSCQNSETHPEDRMPETTEFAVDSAHINNKLDSAKRDIERDRDTAGMPSGR